MNNMDRGIIKWMPFNSICEEQKLIDLLIKKKSKIAKPHLSREQLEEIEKTIIEAFYEQIPVKITYYKNGFLFQTISKIKHIEPTSKKIYLKNQQILLFLQIIKINM